MSEPKRGMPLGRAFLTTLGIFLVVGGGVAAILVLAEYYPLVLGTIGIVGAFSCITWGVHKGW